LKAAKKEDMEGQWAKTSAAKKIARAQKRASLSDLDRFKVMIQRKQRAHVVRKIAKKAIKK
jgi:large subunit ribosomal protein L14e